MASTWQAPLAKKCRRAGASAEWISSRPIFGKNIAGADQPLLRPSSQ